MSSTALFLFISPTDNNDISVVYPVHKACVFAVDGCYHITARRRIVKVDIGYRHKLDEFVRRVVRTWRENNALSVENNVEISVLFGRRRLFGFALYHSINGNGVIDLYLASFGNGFGYPALTGAVGDYLVARYDIIIGTKNIVETKLFSTLEEAYSLRIERQKSHKVAERVRFVDDYLVIVLYVIVLADRLSVDRCGDADSVLHTVNHYRLVGKFARDIGDVYIRINSAFRRNKFDNVTLLYGLIERNGKSVEGYLTRNGKSTFHKLAFAVERKGKASARTSDYLVCLEACHNKHIGNADGACVEDAHFLAVERYNGEVVTLIDNGCNADADRCDIFGTADARPAKVDVLVSILSADSNTFFRYRKLLCDRRRKIRDKTSAAYKEYSGR